MSGGEARYKNIRITDISQNMVIFNISIIFNN